MLSFLATAFVVLAFLIALPARARALRIGGLVYLAACLWCPSCPRRSAAIERYAVLLAPAPLLACELLVARDRERLARAIRPTHGALAFTPAAVVALSSIMLFVAGGRCETPAVAGSEATTDLLSPSSASWSATRVANRCAEVPLATHWRRISSRAHLPRRWP